MDQFNITSSVCQDESACYGAMAVKASENHPDMHFYEPCDIYTGATHAEEQSAVGNITQHGQINSSTDFVFDASRYLVPAHSASGDKLTEAREFIDAVAELENDIAKFSQSREENYNVDGTLGKNQEKRAYSQASSSPQEHFPTGNEPMTQPQI